MSKKQPPPVFPMLILVNRANQAPAWETSEAQNSASRIKQLEQDAGVIWFQAFVVTAYRIEAIKRTVVMNERPTGPDAEGKVE